MVRSHYIEETLKKTFKLWGYEEIRSPTIEFLDVLSTNVGTEIINNMFKFQDYDGKMLALRAEMTAPIARIVTTNIKSFGLPIRLFYLANVFRYSQSYIQRDREFWQAGIEVMGSHTSGTDGEVLALLVSSLRALQLTDVRIDLGHANLLKELFLASNLNDQQVQILQELLTSRDEHRLTSFFDHNTLPSEIENTFLHLSACRRLDEVSSPNIKTSKTIGIDEHLNELITLGEVLTDYNIQDLVYFDFSLTRKIDYYTGIIFEVSVPHLGLPLGGGGRYNQFVEQFGKIKLPAIGFALEIDKCLQALDSQGSKIPIHKELGMMVFSKSRKRAIEVTQFLRKFQITALLGAPEKTERELIDDAKNIGLDYILFIETSVDDPARIYDLQTSSFHTDSIKSFVISLEKVKKP